VSTGGILKSAKLAKTGLSVSVELDYHVGETSYAVIAGLGIGIEVKKDGRILARTDDLKSAKEGWKTSADGLILLKLKHDKRLVKLNVAEKGKSGTP
jgi:hypothetical protein